MALELRVACERCGGALTGGSYECTFCGDCGGKLEGICPNCRGELVGRPRRRMEPSPDWLTDVRAALARFTDVTASRLVPGLTHYELVLTTRNSPPNRQLVEMLSKSPLQELILREDSPVNDRADDAWAAGWNFDTAIGPWQEQLFARLDWDRAIVVHEAAA